MNRPDNAIVFLNHTEAMDLRERIFGLMRSDATTYQIAAFLERIVSSDLPADEKVLDIMALICIGKVAVSEFIAEAEK